MPPKHKLQPPTAKKDVYFYNGCLLRLATASPEPLSRLLSVTRLVIGLCCDVMRPGRMPSDEQSPAGQGAGATGGLQGETPVSLLGNHYVSHRDLGSQSDGTSNRLCFQEICTFDQEEGPKVICRLTKKGATSLASLHWWVDPEVRCKYKRISGHSYVKVKLSGGGKALFTAPEVEGAGPEEYSFELPSLVLHEPLSSQCTLDWKGELSVKCESSGLQARVVLKEGGEVKGSVDSCLDDLGQKAKVTKIGIFSGNWRSAVHVACPSMGLEGVVHDCDAAVSSSMQSMPPTGMPPAPLLHIDLKQLGTMRIPRLWSALHDALLYSDPGLAVGGKAASDLSQSLAASLSGLFFEPLESRDLRIPASAGQHAASGPEPAGDARRRPAETAEDSSGDEAQPSGADRQPMPSSLDARALPPCFKAEHAAGRKLRYQLHAALVHMPFLVDHS